MRRFTFIAVVGVTGLIALPLVCAFSQELQPGARAGSKENRPRATRGSRPRSGHG